MTTRQKQGIEIRQLREALDMTRTDLAGKWGVSVEWIKSIELGRREARPWMIQNLRGMVTGKGEK